MRKIALFLILAPCLHAQAVIQLRSQTGSGAAIYPTASPIVSQYSGCLVSLVSNLCPSIGTNLTQYVVPSPNFDQQPLIYNSLDKNLVGYYQDVFCNGCEWGNGLFSLNPEWDNGASSGKGSGWRLINDAMDLQTNGNGQVTGTFMSSVSVTSGIGTVSVITNGYRFVPTGSYFYIPAGALTSCTGLNGTQLGPVTPAGATAGPNPNYQPQYLSFTFPTSLANCSQSSFTSSTVYLIGPSEIATQPYRRHTEGMVYDTNRNRIYLFTGVGDVVGVPGQIYFGHSGVYSVWYASENNAASGCNVGGITTQKCWQWAPVCGVFTQTSLAVYCATPNTAPVTTPAGNGIPCTNANSSSCGYKFPFIGYDPTDDVIVIFGGQWYSAQEKETLLYYPDTGTWQSLSLSTKPPARWAQGDSRIVSLGKYSHKLLLFGGENGVAPCGSGTCYNDTWIFDTTTLTWTQQVSPGCTTACPNSPPVNLNPAIDFDPYIGKVVHIDNQGTATSPAVCNTATCAHIWFFDPIALSWSDMTAAAITAGAPGYQGTPALNQGTTLTGYDYTGAFDVATNQFVVLIRVNGTSHAEEWLFNMPIPIGTQAIEWPGGCTSCVSPQPVAGTRPSNAVVSTIGWPIPDVFGITCSPNTGTPIGYGCTTPQLEVTNSASAVQNAQFSCVTLWPDGNCEWLHVDTQDPAFTEGTLDLTNLYLSQVASGGGNLPSSAMGGCSSGSPTAATSAPWVGLNATVCASGTYVINTGVATIQVQQANNDLVHSLVVGSTTLVNPSRSYATADGLVLSGPSFGSGQVNVSCTNPPPMTTAAVGSPGACTTLYESINDPTSTCAYLDNGGMMAKLACYGNATNSSNNYAQYGLLYTFWNGHADFPVDVALQNAQKYTQTAPYTSGDTASAGDMLTIWDARLTTNLASGTRNITFGTSPTATATTTLTSTTSGDSATDLQAYTNEDLYPDYYNSPNCATSGTTPELCVTPAISRTGTSPSFTYAINGFQIASTQSITGSTTGTNAPGWAMETDASGDGVEFGINRMAQHWPDALEFMDGAQEIRIGLMPDQTLAAGSPTLQSYLQPWAEYNIKTIWINFFTSAPSSPFDAFVEYQQPLWGRMPPFTYNTGLPIALPDSCIEDEYYIGLSPQPSFASGATSSNKCQLLADVGCSTSCFGQNANTLTTMYNFPKYVWTTGGPNQQDAAMAAYYQSLQRGWNGTQMVLAGSQPGKFQWAWNFYRDQVAKGCVPRSDFSGNWRGVTYVGQVFETWGYPAKLTTWNLGQRDWCDEGLGQDHYHLEGVPTFYLLTGDYWLGQQVTQQGMVDMAIGTNIPYNAPVLLTGHAVPAAIRSAAHTIGVGSMVLADLCGIHSPLVYSGSPASCQPAALAPMEKAAAYDLLAPAFAHGYSLPPYSVTELSDCQTMNYTAADSIYPSTCTTGKTINGDIVGGQNPNGSNNTCPGSTAPCQGGSFAYHATKAYQNQAAQFDLHLLDSVAENLYRGTRLYATSETLLNDGLSTNVTVPITGANVQQQILGSALWAFNSAMTFGSSGANSSMNFLTFGGYLNSTPPCTNSDTDCSRTANLGTFEGENYTHLGSICQETNSVVDLYGTSRQLQWEYYIDRMGTGAYTELYSPEMMYTDYCIINHNLANPNSYTLGPVPTLQDVQLSQSFVPYGSTTVNWNVPIGLTSINETTYRMTYSANEIIDWQQFYPNCNSVYTEGLCTAASLLRSAADGRGGWDLGQPPESGVHSRLTRPPINDPALQSANGSYKVICPLSVGCNIDLNSHALSTIPICVSDQVCLVPTSYNFGSIALGIPSPVGQFTLYNETSSSIGIAPSVSGANAPDFPYSVPGSGGCGSSLASDSSCIIDDIFTPSISGAETANLNVNYSTSGGTFINAASCNNTSANPDIQNALNSISGSGAFKIVIPSGTCTFSQAYSYSVSNPITLVGATTCTAGCSPGSAGVGLAFNDLTNITFMAPFTISGCSATNFCDISGLTLISGLATSNGLFAVGGVHPQVGFHIHDLHWSNTTLTSGVMMKVYSGYGLIDHVLWNSTTTGGTPTPLNIYGDGPSYGYANWADPSPWGTNQAVIVEDFQQNDSYASTEGFSDNYEGCKIVFRYGIMNGTTPGGWHGTDSSPNRGCVQGER